MIPRERKKLAVIAAVVAIIILIAVASILWWGQLSPDGREQNIVRIKSFLLQGTISGGTFALLALGFTLAYGVAGLINMAHGAIYMLGAYAFYAFFTNLGYDVFKHSTPILIVAFILAIIVVGILGGVAYRTSIQPVVEDPLAAIVVSVGIIIIIQQVMLIEFGTEYLPIWPLGGSKWGLVDILGATVTKAQLAAFGISMALFFGLWLFVAKSKIGTAMRAVAQDIEVAMLMGINTDRLQTLTIAIASAFAAAAGILITSAYAGTVQPYRTWQYPLALSFGIVILGGLGSIKGSLIGAFIIGYSDNFVVSIATMFHPEGAHLKGAVALAAMVLVLLLRPRGLFGKRVELED